MLYVYYLFVGQGDSVNWRTQWKIQSFFKKNVSRFIYIINVHEYFCLHVSVCATCMPSAHRDQKTQALCKSNNVFLIAESSPQPQIPGYCSLNKLGLATHPNPSTGMASDENQSTSLCHLGQQPTSAIGVLTQLQREFEVSLGYMLSCLNTKKVLLSIQCS